MSSSSLHTSHTQSHSKSQIEWSVHYDATSSLYTHPRNLAALALMSGHQPPPVEEARILELGCATGGNLTPIALSLPRSECVGIDPFESQIDKARQRAEDSQAHNVTYLPIGVSDVDQLSGTFDYIIAHGLFSWISDEHREDTLKLCRKLLSTQGIAYISYNTYPHWHMEQSTRSLLRWQHQHLTQKSSTADGKTRSDHELIQEARSLLSVFARYAINADSCSIRSIYQRSTDRIKHLPDWYIVHEYLLENNRAFYFDEWVKLAADFDLSYLGDAASNTELSFALMPMAVRHELQAIHHDTIGIQQGVDFLVSRGLRRSIICRQEVRSNTQEVSLTPWTDPLMRDSETFGQLFVASYYLLDSDMKGLNEKAIYRDVTSHKDQSFVSDNTSQNALLLLLSSVWPQQLSLRDLFEQAETLLKDYNLWGSKAQLDLDQAFHLLLCKEVILHPTLGEMNARQTQDHSGHSDRSSEDPPRLLAHVKGMLKQWPQSFTNYHHTSSFPSEALHWFISRYDEHCSRDQLRELLQQSPFTHVSIDDIFTEAMKLALLSSLEQR